MSLISITDCQFVSQPFTAHDWPQAAANAGALLGEPGRAAMAGGRVPGAHFLRPAGVSKIDLLTVWGGARMPAAAAGAWALGNRAFAYHVVTLISHRLD